MRTEANCAGISLESILSVTYMISAMLTGSFSVSR